MSVTAKRYTSVSKGGEYEIVGVSSGAGQRKGDVAMVYRNVATGQLFHREPEDFSMRMKPLEPSINTQLLAALEALLHEEGGTIGMSRNDPRAAAALAAIAAAKGEV